jgi:two-component system response regulator HydG
MKNLLIIDDDPDIGQLLDKFLTKKGFQVYTSETGSEGVELLKQNAIDLVLCDFKLPDYNGLEILRKIKVIDNSVAVVMITGYSDVKVAVESLKQGAFEYVTKPLFPDEILQTINEALESTEEVTQQENRSPAEKEETYIEGVSPNAQLVQKHIELIAPTDMSVIITGETGTGKEYVAKAIHHASRRSEEPFIALDCGALPKELAGSELFGHKKGAFTGALQDKKGCFEVADGGTLFLDEIGNLTYENQIKLLRVLQERQVKRIGSNQVVPVNVRILVATNEDLKNKVRSGDFREDLYHRLNEFSIHLAPLRERKDDIMRFARHFLKQASFQLFKNMDGFSKPVERILKNHYWHGNLRELRNVIKRAVLLAESKMVLDENLPEEIRKPELSFQYDQQVEESVPAAEEEVGDLKSIVERAEKQAILNVLKRTGYNKSKTADILKVDRKTLYNKMKAYEISLEE